MPNPKRSKPSNIEEVSIQPQRINKLLAASGYGSRRDCESLITTGRVEIDGQTITELGTKVDPETSIVKVDGTVLKRGRQVYFVLNKPPGVLCTNKDPSGRMLAIDLIPTRERVFSVGRLDRASEGLILLTNDGELAQRLAHPKYGVQKTYFAIVQGEITQQDMANLRKGVYLSDGFARVDGVKLRRQRKGCAELEIVLSEGKNREIRRVLARLGHKVMSLRRLAIGSLRLGTLPLGASRELAREEVASLYAVAASSRRAKRKRKPPQHAATVPAEDEATLDVDADLLAEIDVHPRPTGQIIAYDDDNPRSDRPGTTSRGKGKSPRAGKRPVHNADARSTRSPLTKKSGTGKTSGRPNEKSRKFSGPPRSKSVSGSPVSSRSSSKPGKKMASRKRPSRGR